MPIEEVVIPVQPKRIGDYRPSVARGPTPNVLFRYNWQTSIDACGARSYFAQVNESLVLNVHRRGGKGVWEWLAIGFDLTKTEAPLISAMGTAGSMKEAKYLAEQRIPPRTPAPGTNTQVWPEDLPF